jgi:hypothetical protein
MRLTKEQRKLMRIVMAPWLRPHTVSFDEWCAACDELYGAP